MSSIFSFFFDFLGFFSCISLLCCLITFSVPQQKIRGSWTLLIPAFSSSQCTSSLIFSSCPYQISGKFVSPHAPSAYFVITTKARDSSAPWHCDPRPLARGVLRRYRRKTIII